MDFLMNYWWVILIGVAAVTSIIVFTVRFFKRPTKEQIAKLKEWLLYAVTEAEKLLGDGTGKIKLRYVYDLFLTKFPYLAKIIPFEVFSNLVDEVLDNFRGLLETHPQIEQYVSEGATSVVIV